MLHLAQVQKNSTSGKKELKILACHDSKNSWQVGDVVCLPLTNKSWREGVLVLVESGNKGQIINIKEAEDLIFSLLEDYYSNGSITPQFVATEQAKVERWRQEITSQSLELNRRALEIETRREQLQELEQVLKQDQEKLAQQEERVQKLGEELRQKQ